MLLLLKYKTSTKHLHNAYIRIFPLALYKAEIVCREREGKILLDAHLTVLDVVQLTLSGQSQTFCCSLNTSPAGQWKVWAPPSLLHWENTEQSAGSRVTSPDKHPPATALRPIFWYKITNNIDWLRWIPVISVDLSELNQVLPGLLDWTGLVKVRLRIRISVIIQQDVFYLIKLHSECSNNVNIWNNARQRISNNTDIINM